MQKYTIFKTKYGWFGLLVLNGSVLRTILPKEDRQYVKSDLLFRIRGAEEDPGIFPELQNQIVHYFEGGKVEFFPDIPLILDVLTDFSKDILLACRKIPYGETRSYAEIAQIAGHPNAARAVGNALGNNPVPLIIPCHRIIKSNGEAGGFMKNQPGASEFKKVMLELENGQHG